MKEELERDDSELVWGIGKGEKDKRGLRERAGCSYWAKSRGGCGERHERVHFCSIISGAEIKVRRFSVLMYFYSCISMWV